MKMAVCAVGVACCVAAWAGPAGAHGKQIKTNPKRGAVVARPPGQVTVTLTEPATDAAVITVTDGCNQTLDGHIVVSGKELLVHVPPGRPGKYRVEWKAISAVDGHSTDGSFAFTVKGKRDCSSDKDKNGGATPTPDEPAATQPPGGSDESSFPVVPVSLGALGVLGIALIARFAGSR
jgi:copper resistance protein C